MPAENDPDFEIVHEGEADPSETLVIGMSEPGMAGITAVSYLCNQLDLEKTGHITTDDTPSLTPFVNGEPRHHTRFMSKPDFGYTFLIGELFIPLWASKSFSNAVMSWTSESNIEEILFLSGVPIQHSPEEHKVFYVATDDYAERRLTSNEIPPMAGGFLEGVKADLIAEGIDSRLAVGSLLTPVHPPVQDVEAAIRLTRSFDEIYGFDVGTQELERYEEDLKKQYSQLAEQLNEIMESDTSLKARDKYSDRAFM